MQDYVQNTINKLATKAVKIVSLIHVIQNNTS